MTRDILMFGFVIVGMVMISRAKIQFQKRQRVMDDNKYSSHELIVLYAGYAFMAMAFILAAFIKF